MRSILHLRLPSPIGYASASAIQDALVSGLSRGGRPTATATVLTMEMRPVYTTGRRERGLMSDADRAVLTGTGAEVVDALRGGQITFHGPGQLVVYPILSLAEFKIRPRCYVNTLESCVIATLADFGIAAHRTGDTGVWVTETEKIASIGVHLQHRITSHGLALNVTTDLGYFDHIVACGLVGKRTTSMAAVLQAAGTRPTTPPPSVQHVADVFVKHFAKALDVQTVETKTFPISTTTP